VRAREGQKKKRQSGDLIRCEEKNVGAFYIHIFGCFIIWFFLGSLFPSIQKKKEHPSAVDIFFFCGIVPRFTLHFICLT
jgi:hypothetical protein